MSEKKYFEKGMFITYKNKPDSFAIYEGNDISETSYKRLTVLCYYDPKKYTQTSQYNYEHVPNLEVATKMKRCEKTVDTDCEDSWWCVCTEEQIAAAMKILDNYGYAWDSEIMSLIDTSTGEIVKKIVIPKLEYDGRIIKPMNEDFKKMLSNSCINKNKTKYDYSNYGSMYGDNEWDYD